MTHITSFFASQKEDWMRRLENFMVLSAKSVIRAEEKLANEFKLNGIDAFKELMTARHSFEAPVGY